MTAARLVLIVAIIGALLLLVAGPGARLELWDFRAGFALMRWAVYIGIGTGAVALLMLLVPRTRRRSAASLLLALVVALTTAAIPLYARSVARSVPPIHDISTDTERPPAFVAVLPLRADAPNSAEHAGEELARTQRAAYPDIVTHRVAAAPAEALARAERAARAMGWDIVAVDAAAGRIEATDTTLFFGFKDDVVVRVEADGAGGSRVDVRSVSRVGMSDVGKNAARIRAYLRRIGS
jgi:uncharacterized protein (DUF1499 family)